MDLEAGRLLIINHIEFTDKDMNRPGSDKDADLLRKHFGKYNVPSKVILNPTYDEVRRVTNKMQNYNFRKNSCFIYAILSHGSKNNTIVSSDLKTYSLWDDIVIPILRNETLFDKPKIFIVNACKGDIETDCNYNIIKDKKLEEDSISTNELHSEVKNLNRINPSNYYIFYSTSEGFVSYRYPISGSIFINFFCNVLEKYGSTHNIEQIFDLTSKNIQSYKSLQQRPSKLIQGPDNYIFGEYC